MYFASSRGETVFNQILLDDFIVVKLVDKTPTRIKLPDWQRVLRGDVVAAGPGKLLYNGKRAKMACKVGDYVLFKATAGMDTQYAGESARMMRDVDVDCVLEGK
jgi:chaperonin GroES